jgi:uncharacterized protein YndB with AHSA1/START domain
MKKSIKHVLFFPHPPEVVWDYLTKSELIAQWLMENNFQPTRGHEFHFRIDPMPHLNFDGFFYCKVLEIVPGKKLSYSWRFGSGDGTLHDSQVNWILKETDDGTELQLVHDAYKGAEMITLFSTLDEGWIVLIEKMKQQIMTTHGATKS